MIESLPNRPLEPDEQDVLESSDEIWLVDGISRDIDGPRNKLVLATSSLVAALEYDDGWSVAYREAVDFGAEGFDDAVDAAYHAIGLRGGS
jgi:hypothetical protein